MEVISIFNGNVRILDQSLLPHKEEYIVLTNIKDVCEAIKTLKIRGAPLIGVAAALTMASHMDKYSEENPSCLDDFFMQGYHALLATRPTAVNLKWSLDIMKDQYERDKNYDLDHIKKSLFQSADTIFKKEEKTCDDIGLFGAELIPKGSKVLTHCNAGRLATVGIGSALGVIEVAYNQGKIVEVFVDETRPLLQGARLTAWELSKAGIPYKLICDSMAGVVIKKFVNAIIVGADRIVRNGDTANKIGTYVLAVLAKSHDIPFYVAAPISTIDYSLVSGHDIPIEVRSASEIVEVNGNRIAPQEIDVFNPAFDVTPAEFITAIITEKGVLYPPFNESIKNAM